MPTESHYVAEVKIEKVTPKTISTSERIVDEYMRIVVKDDSLEGLKEKIAAHIGLV